MTSNHRKLTEGEIAQLLNQGCSCDDWSQVLIDNETNIKYLRNTRFSGTVKIGKFEKSFEMPGGIHKHTGIFNATLHNVVVGDNCCIENIKNYIANYIIDDETFIENVDILLVDKPTAFGNGVEVSVLNETGGREVTIHDRLSAHEAFIEAMYRHRPELVSKLKDLAHKYAESQTSAVGIIGKSVTIVDAGYIKNVKIGDGSKIEGAGRLKNGTLNSTLDSPIHIGYGVVLDDFIIESGSSVEDGSMLSRCYLSQNCKMSHTYSASDSLFFSNCHGENGEACAIFAGPFTVTHHKSTLLIAGMFSFMNAGSGSNQSNHMYKLGPIHQGVLERGAKTTSDSYILWPSRVGAFSLVMGRHVGNVDSSDLPFSYLIEQQGSTYLVPAINLKSVGTIRDAQKWPKRDKRPLVGRIDQINYNLLSPYTMQKALRGRRLLLDMQQLAGPTSDYYTYHSAKITNRALSRGIQLYDTAITKFLGNSVIQRLINQKIKTVAQLRKRLLPDFPSGSGEWVDIAGLIVPKSEVATLIDDVLSGTIDDIEQLNARFQELHSNYYEMEWTWAYGVMMNYFGLDIETVTPADIISIVEKWKHAVVSLDEMVYADAKKEFSLSAKTGFGTDCNPYEAELDFEQVRGAFESNSFVTAVLEHIKKKSALGNTMISQLQQIR